MILRRNHQANEVTLLKFSSKRGTQSNTCLSHTLKLPEVKIQEKYRQSFRHHNYKHAPQYLEISEQSPVEVHDIDQTENRRSRVCKKYTPRKTSE